MGCRERGASHRALKAPGPLGPHCAGVSSLPELSPRSPLEPFGPRAPAGPGCPGGPIFPGGPCKPRSPCPVVRGRKSVPGAAAPSLLPEVPFDLHRPQKTSREPVVTQRKKMPPAFQGTACAKGQLPERAGLLLSPCNRTSQIPVWKCGLPENQRSVFGLERMTFHGNASERIVPHCNER